jgi:hypothetical protein
MFARLKRWVYGRLKALDNRIKWFLEDHFKCEVCGEERADYTCIGCGKRICGGCDSHYYTDEELCVKCECEITPEERARDLKEHADYLLDDCQCGVLGKTCELDADQHAFITEHATKADGK